MQIPLSRPDIMDLERQAVQEVLLTPRLAIGFRGIQWAEFAGNIKTIPSSRQRQHAVYAIIGMEARCGFSKLHSTESREF